MENLEPLGKQFFTTQLLIAISQCTRGRNEGKATANSKQKHSEGSAFSFISVIGSRWWIVWLKY